MPTFKTEYRIGQKVYSYFKPKKWRTFCFVISEIIFSAWETVLAGNGASRKESELFKTKAEAVAEARKLNKKEGL